MGWHPITSTATAMTLQNRPKAATGGGALVVLKGDPRNEAMVLQFYLQDTRSIHLKIFVRVIFTDTGIPSAWHEVAATPEE